jgi:hypothetical protein
MTAQLCIRGLIVTIILSAIVIMKSMIVIMPQFGMIEMQAG